jgi:hypothetical protein
MICIIDSGFLVSHEDLQGINVDGYDGNLPWNQDGLTHGTHVAGTIAAVNNDFGVVGVTPGTVNLYIVRVFADDGDWAYASTLIDAANRCASAGANIISMSLGGGDPSLPEQQAYDLLYAQGILTIAAAGNDGNNEFLYPASHPSVMSVAAIDSNKAVASFSQRNSQVDIAAPGVGVLSTVGSSYESYDGTSMATPHVSAVAALVWSAMPSATNKDVRSALYSSAEDLGVAGRDDVYGYGLVRAKLAIENLLYGTSMPTPYPTTSSPTVTQAPSTCIGSTPDWVDSDGDGCDWYERNDDPGCPYYGSSFGGGMGVADDNCCYCFGAGVSVFDLPSHLWPHLVSLLLIIFVFIRRAPSPSIQRPTYSPTVTHAPTTSAAPSTCMGSTPGWVHSSGNGCDWYKACDLPGCPYSSSIDGADDNCCYCFGFYLCFLHPFYS